MAAVGDATRVELAATTVTGNSAGTSAGNAAASDSSAAATCSASAGSDANGAGDGGGLWASAGAAIAVGAASRLSSNSGARFGGAAAAVNTASLAFSGGAEASGNSARSGGAVALLGAAGLTADTAFFHNNTAIAGAFAFLGNADDALRVLLFAVSFENNAAGFGGLYALFALGAPGGNVTLPECRACPHSTSPGGGSKDAPAPASADWYGPTVATHPAAAASTTPASSAVNGRLLAHVTLVDGFNQAVRAFPTVVTATCHSWQQAPTNRGGAQQQQQPPGPCPAGSLITGADQEQEAEEMVRVVGDSGDGAAAVLYKNFSAKFTLRLRGAPGGSFTLRFAFSSTGWPPIALSPFLSRSIVMQPCLCASLLPPPPAAAPRPRSWALVVLANSFASFVRLLDLPVVLCLSVALGISRPELS